MHPRAKLTVQGHRLLVTRVLEHGWPAAEAARAQGVSVATCSKWLGRYRVEGTAGLADRSCRPHLSPRRLSAEREQAIVAWRQTHRVGRTGSGGPLARPAPPSGRCWPAIGCPGWPTWTGQRAGGPLSAAAAWELLQVDIKA